MPIFGDPYDEYIPTDTALEQRSSEGAFIYKGSLRHLFDIYRTLSHRGEVTFAVWISYFTDRIRQPCASFARPTDPFGTRETSIFHADPPARACHTRHRDVGRETLLTAFIAWWLCYFVVSSQPVGIIRPDTFVMASRLARGNLISLTIPVLANLFKSMRVVSTSCDPSFCIEVVPYHYLLGSAHMYWAGLYTPAMGSDMLHRLPLLAQIAGAKAVSVPPWKARKYFRQGEGFLRLCSGRQFACHDEQTENLIFYDATPGVEDQRPLRLGSPESGFLVSLRHGLLPLRLGSMVVLEPYMPHRCAHQFGLD